jgi:hypothetical protein
LFDEYFIDSLFAYHSRLGTGKSRDEVAAAYVHRADKSANILAPVEAQCDWLRALGYEEVDCFFKTFELALFGGRRPPSGNGTMTDAVARPGAWFEWQPGHWRDQR